MLNFKASSKLARAAFLIAPLAIAPLVPAVASAQEIAAPSGTYVMDPTHASITFKIAHLGLAKYTARFTKFDIALALDVDDPSKSTVSAVIDPKSVKTDYPGKKDFDAEIASDKKFLNAGQFPEIKFTSTSVEKTGDSTAKVTGDLTMLGVTKPVTLDVTLNSSLASHPFAKKPAVGFSAVGSIVRDEWGLTHLGNKLPSGQQIVGSEVTVLIEAEFTQAK